MGANRAKASLALIRTRERCDLQGEDLLLIGVGGFLAAWFAQLKFELLALVNQGRTFVTNGLKGQALTEGFTDADGIGGLAVHLKDGKAVECTIGIFTGCNHTAQKDGVGT